MYLLYSGLVVVLGLFFRSAFLGMSVGSGLCLCGILLLLALFICWSLKHPVLLALCIAGVLGLHAYLERPHNPPVAARQVPPAAAPSVPANKPEPMANRALDKQLFQAIDAQNVNRVKELLAQGADANAQDPNLGTPLRHLYSFNGPWTLPMMQALVEAGADVNKISQHFTPLGMAAVVRRADLVEFLLRNGADVNLMADRTPLMLAAESGDEKIVWMLLNGGANPNQDKNGYTALKEAIFRDNLPLVQLLVRHGADVNFAGTWQQAFGRGYPPVMDTLVAHGMHADNDQINVAVAAYKGKTEQVKSWLEAAHSSGEAKEYLLVWSAAGGHADTVNLLLNAGVRQEAASSLVTACSAGYTEIVNLLLAQRPRLDPKDEQRCFHLAVEHGHTDTVQALLAAGWDPNIPDPHGFGQTALFAAVRQHNLEMIRTLLAGGTNVNLEDATSQLVPLHAASSAGNLESVQILVEAGADVNHKDQFGQTPLFMAGAHADVAAYLRAHGAKK